MNFRIFKGGEPANTYHCFKCGASGNMLTLYADVRGLYGADRYRQAYREIKEALLGGTYAVTQKTQQEAVSCVEARPAEPQKLDQVYRRLHTGIFPQWPRKLGRRFFSEKQRFPLSGLWA